MRSVRWNGGALCVFSSLALRVFADDDVNKQRDCSSLVVKEQENEEEGSWLKSACRGANEQEKRILFGADSEDVWRSRWAARTILKQFLRFFFFQHENSGTRVLTVSFPSLALKCQMPRLEEHCWSCSTSSKTETKHPSSGANWLASRAEEMMSIITSVLSSAYISLQDVQTANLIRRGVVLFTVGVFLALVLNLLQIQRNVTLFPEEVMTTLFSSAWWIPPCCGTGAGEWIKGWFYQAYLVLYKRPCKGSFTRVISSLQLIWGQRNAERGGVRAQQPSLMKRKWHFK